LRCQDTLQVRREIACCSIAGGKAQSPAAAASRDAHNNNSSSAKTWPESSQAQPRRVSLAARFNPASTRIRAQIAEEKKRDSVPRSHRLMVLPYDEK
jgi:hypothetical protein